MPSLEEPCSQHLHMCANPEAPWTPSFWCLCGGFVTQACWIIDSILSPAPFSREWRTGLKITSVWSWLGFSYNQPSSRSPSTVSLEQKTLLSPWRFQEFHELWARNRSQRPLLGQEMLHSVLITWGITRVLGVLFQKLGAETNMYFLYYLTSLQVLGFMLFQHC